MGVDDGYVVGRYVGCCDGCGDGDIVGCPEGVLLGATVGVKVGCSVALPQTPQVEAQVVCTSCLMVELDE